MELKPTAHLNVGDPRHVNLYVAGCGGTGSYLVQRLARLAGHARELGIQVQLTLIDPDRVEPKNLWRQLFVEPEIGQCKAEALAVRYGRGFGLPIRFYNEKMQPDHIDTQNRYRDGWLHVLVGCVDNVKARAAIASIVKGWSGRLWWLDCGNDHHNGQLILGNKDDIATPEISPLGYCTALPLPSVVMPDLVVEYIRERGRESEGHSCADDALANVQGLMINELVAAYAAHYLYRLIITRDLDTWITYFNLQAGNARSIYIQAEPAPVPEPVAV